MTDPHDKTNLLPVSKTKKPKAPSAPGGLSSPQQPGKTPDRSSIPGHFSTRVSRPASKQRPLTQYGSAEEIMHIYKRAPENEIKPESFEHAPASFEEMRKATLVLLQPGRPKARAIDAGDAPVAIPADATSV